jgi:DNA-directed RNA polymerase subunit RPC12/RpoP
MTAAKEIIVLRCPECSFTTVGQCNQKLASLIVVQCPHCSYETCLSEWKEEGLDK